MVAGIIAGAGASTVRIPRDVLLPCASVPSEVVVCIESAARQPSAAHVARYGSLKLLLLCHSFPLTMRFRHGSLTVRPKLSSFTSLRNFAFCTDRQGRAQWVVKSSS